VDRVREWPRRPLPKELADPVALAHRLSGRPGLVMLDGDGSEPRGLRSFVGSDPVAIVRASAGDPDPFAVFDGMQRDEDAPPWPRYVGYVAYDAAVARIDGERHPRDAGDVVWFGRYDAIAIFEATGRAFVVGEDEPAIARFLARAMTSVSGEPTPGASVSELEIDDAESHAASVARAVDAIHRGDLYQVNLARRFSGSFEGDALALYRAMRDASPVPFGAYLAAGDRTLLGRSMESFLAFDARTRRLVTRPIKGTVAASGDRDDDATTLLADPKEHAEHVMVVDLLRNDLGRVARIGSVRVDEAFVVEPFARLSHLVSTVACELREGTGLGTLLRETFPPGSVTGTPKRAAMRTIEAYEKHARGVYCGAYGYVAADGSMQLAVAIRTATIADGALTYWAGGGIVAASDPEREVAETELKARVLRDALERLTQLEAHSQTSES